MNQPEFRNLADLHLKSPSGRILFSSTGSDAGAQLVRRMKLDETISGISMVRKDGINVVVPEAVGLLVPGSRTVGFSGWSDPRSQGIDKQDKFKDIEESVKLAINHIHEAILSTDRPYFYATAGNDPKTSEELPKPFETLVHGLGENPNITYLGIAAKSLNTEELNPRVRVLSFVSNNWTDRATRFVLAIEVLITSGGNDAVISQAYKAAQLKKPHLHISGANTITDLAIEQMQNMNPNLKILSPEKIMTLSLDEILSLLHLKQ